MNHAGTFRHPIFRLCLCLVLVPTVLGDEPPPRPITLHPDNPHYFLFRGKPTVLITSAEHYGAVINPDFDYVRYLDELQRHGFNLTRTFSGVYREHPLSIAVLQEKNPLAPKPERFVCPWPRSDVPGALDGGAKFDLDRWNPDYFRRLRGLVAEAGKRDVVVELVLFCNMYEDTHWRLSPLRAENNIQGISPVGHLDFFTLKDEDLVRVQEKLVQKIVAELSTFDNVYYEICNEPYWTDGKPLVEEHTKDWQAQIAMAIVDAEKDLPARHLIAQNFGHWPWKLDKPNPQVSIFNFHYARPEFVKDNYDLNKAIGFDETGFRGAGDLPYRTDGWEFILAGGAVYDNLDWSFAPGHENGDVTIPDTPKIPGGGGLTLRKQLAILKRFIEGFDFVRMKPDQPVLKGGVPAGGYAQVLAERGEAYAIYVRGGTRAELVLDLPAGSYRAEWVNTTAGTIDRSEDFTHGGGDRRLLSPEYVHDVALRVKRIEPK